MSAITANSATISNVETYITNYGIVGGASNAGDSYRIHCAAQHNGTENFVTTFNVRWGTTGTLADPVIFSTQSIRKLNDGTDFFNTIVVTIRSIGASGSIIVVADQFTSNPIGNTAVINTTVTNYLGLSVVTSDAYVKLVFPVTTIEQIQPYLISFSGYSNVISNTLSTTQNNWAPTGFGPNTTLLLATVPSGGANVTGISNVGRTQGLPCLIYNTSQTDSIYFINLSGSSTTGNQLSCPGNANVVLGPQYSVSVMYVPTTPQTWIFA